MKIKKQDELIKKGFQLDSTVEIVDMIYRVGSAYPKEVICRLWARNPKGEKLLVEEKILKIEEVE